MVLVCGGLSTGVQAGATEGGILLLDRCPDDHAAASQVTYDESLAGLLTPVLSGMVSQGLARASKRLSEAAKEAVVDVVHVGDHFYQGQGGRFGLRHRCFVVWTKGTKKSGRTFEELTTGYGWWTDGPKRGDLPRFTEDNRPLLAKFGSGMGEAKVLPGIFAVFEVELSEQRSEARLVPRFIVMDHSVREKRIDKKERTVAFQFSLSVPGTEGPFGAPLVKADGLVQGKPVSRRSSLTSSWFQLPPLPESVGSARAAHREARARASSERETARLAVAAAKALGDVEVLDDAGATEDVQAWKCPSIAAAREGLALRHGDQQRAEDDAEVRKHENAKVFYSACWRYQEARLAVEELEKNGAGRNQIARSFDLEVTVTEFRERPLVEFLGDVLADEGTRSGLTSAVVAAIDPATRAVARESAIVAAEKAQEAFEAAYIAAEMAIAAFNEKVDSDPGKAKAHIEMEAKKRAANRSAKALGRPVPYPDSGLWIW